MKRLLFLSIIALGILSSCSKDDTVYGSGHLVSEFRELNPFSKLRSEGVFEVSITQGPVQSVEIIADDNVIHRVKTTVKNNELRLTLTDDNFHNIKLSAKITVPNLSGITNEGVGNITASNFNQPNDFSITNTGTGDIAITGSAQNLRILNEGSGNIHGFEFEVHNADVENIGSGKVEVNCTENLNIVIDGSGNVYYKGEPVINVTSSGSGNVVKVD